MSSAGLSRQHFSYDLVSKPDQSFNSTKQCHSDMITCIIRADEKQKFTVKNMYITGSKDGTVKIWNVSNLSLMESFELAKKKSKSWVTCISHMKQASHLVVGCSDRSLSFFDLNASKSNMGIPNNRISKLDGVPLTMDCHFFEKRKEHVLFVGDDLGILHLFKFSDKFHVCEWMASSEVVIKRKILIVIQN